MFMTEDELDARSRQYMAGLRQAAKNYDLTLRREAMLDAGIGPKESQY